MRGLAERCRRAALTVLGLILVLLPLALWGAWNETVFYALLLVCALAAALFTLLSRA